MGPPWGTFCQINLTSCYIKLGFHVINVFTWPTVLCDCPSRRPHYALHSVHPSIRLTPAGCNSAMEGGKKLKFDTQIPHSNCKLNWILKLRVQGHQVLHRSCMECIQSNNFIKNNNNNDMQGASCQNMVKVTLWLVAWHSGRTLIIDWQTTFPVLHSICSRRLTTYVGKLSAVGQPTRPTQPFILSE